MVDDDVARDALANAWRATAAAAAASNDTSGFAAFVDLLAEIRECEIDMRNDLATQSGSVMDGVRRALGGLRNAQTVTELIHRAPEAAARLGFDRVLLSKIQDQAWVPDTVFADCDPRCVQEFLEIGRRHPRTLDGSLVETQIVRRRKAWLVADVAKRSDLHWKLITASRTLSYVAAPITVGDEVAGLLHADRYLHSQPVGVRDREMLWLFCEGLSNICSQVAITGYLNSLRDELDRLFASLSQDSLDVWASSAITCSAHALPSRVADPHHLFSRNAVERSLTRREMEVLLLVSEGLTNAQIARRLFIGEGTVKSHVKAILRKLHASHRAEAVSIWLSETNKARTTVR
jgi:DNA-binding CsgD family transcriptional regulator